MVTVKDIAWVAGLLEGEGCFHLNRGRAPTIGIGMTDLDTIERFKFVTKGAQKIHKVEKTNSAIAQLRKPAYSFQIGGSLAIEWMMTMYPLMGLRRKAKIREILHGWKNLRPAQLIANKVERQHSAMIEIIMKARNISREEAEVKYLEILAGEIK